MEPTLQTERTIYLQITGCDGTTSVNMATSIATNLDVHEMLAVFEMITATLVAEVGSYEQSE